MKVRVILTLLIAFLSSVNVLATNINFNDGSFSLTDLPPVLQGEIGTDTGRSAISKIPILVSIADATTFNVEFTKAIGAVEISINGEAIQTCNVKTVGQSTTISVVGYGPGVYTLEFRTPEGGYVYGEFEIIELPEK